ncbi:MAG: hypothetical protein ACJATN_000435 [Neolewinella sp.]|jgi:hypothetical protein
MKLTTIDDLEIRMDKQSGFVSLTDMAKLQDPKDPNRIMGRWLRTSSAIQFFQAWENRNHDASVKPPDFGGGG